MSIYHKRLGPLGLFVEVLKLAAVLGLLLVGLTLAFSL